MLIRFLALICNFNFS